MIKTYSIKNNEFFFKNIIIFFLIYDFFVKLLVSNKIAPLDLYRYIVVFKALIIVLIIIYSKKLNLNKVFLRSLVMLTLAFCISQITLIDHLDKPNILFNGYYFLSSFLPLLLLLFYNNSKIDILEYQMKLFLGFMVVNSICIFIGYIFNIQLFKTYVLGGSRFGFQGLLMYHSEAGFLYFIALNIANYYYKKKRTLTNGLILSLLFLSSFLIGTKKVLFLIIIFSIYFILDNRKLLLSKFGLYVSLCFMMVLFLFRNIIKDIFFKQFTLFKSIYDNEGFLSSFLSHRNILLEQNFLPFINDKWSYLNIICGGPLFSDSRIELEFFDLFLFFGILGIVAYVLLFRFLCFKSCWSSNFIIFNLIFASLFSGNLLSSVNTMSIMFLSILFMNHKKNATLKK